MVDSSSEREPIEELAESFLTRFRAGERPSLTELTAARPELAHQILELFPALSFNWLPLGLSASPIATVRSCCLRSPPENTR